MKRSHQPNERPAVTRGPVGCPNAMRTGPTGISSHRSEPMSVPMMAPTPNPTAPNMTAARARSSPLAMFRRQLPIASPAPVTVRQSDDMINGPANAPVAAPRMAPTAAYPNVVPQLGDRPRLTSTCRTEANGRVTEAPPPFRSPSMALCWPATL